MNDLRENGILPVSCGDSDFFSFFDIPVFSLSYTQKTWKIPYLQYIYINIGYNNVQAHPCTYASWHQYNIQVVFFNWPQWTRKHYSLHIVSCWQPSFEVSVSACFIFQCIDLLQTGGCSVLSTHIHTLTSVWEHIKMARRLLLILMSTLFYKGNCFSLHVLTLKDLHVWYTCVLLG